MRIKKITSALFALLFSFACVAPCYAASFDCSVSFDSSTMSVGITGTSSSSVMAYVYPKASSPSEFSNVNVPQALEVIDIYGQQTFTHSIPLNPQLSSGEYVVDVGNNDGKVTYSFKYLNPVSAQGAIDVINLAVPQSAAKIYQATSAGSDELLLSDSDLRTYGNFLGEIIYGRKTTFVNPQAFLDVYDEAKAIYDTLIAPSDTGTEAMLRANQTKLGIDMSLYYDILSADAKRFMIQKLSSDNGYMREAFSTHFKKISLLSAIAKAAKWQDIKTALTTTHQGITTLDMTGVRNVDEVYRAMMNYSYSSFGDISANFEKAKASVVSGSSVTSGKGSSGGGVPVVGDTSGQVSQEQNNTPSLSFTDIAMNHWAKSAIDNLVAKGVLSGYGDKTFRPANNITRAEFVKMIVGAFSIEGSAELPFDDVENDAWYKSYLSAAYGAGIISGTGENSFEPDYFITRQDASLIIYRIIKDKLPKGGELSFADNDEIADYAFDAIAALSDEGIIKGVGESRFAPRAHIDRQSAAVLIYNCLK